MARGKKKESALTPEEKLAQALVHDWEQPYKVPGNWKWIILGNLVEIRRGASPRPIKAYVTEDETGINWIKIGDTDSGKYITHVAEKITSDGAKKSVFVEEGTLLLSNSMSFGRPYILKVNGCIHDGWLAITPSTAFNKEYLYYALLASEWYFEQVAVGTAVRNLNSDRVSGTPVPCPPLAEQQRIVDRIEYMFSKLDEAKEKAQSVLDSFEPRKAAIFHKALAGELTVAWRKNNQVDSADYVAQSRMHRDAEIAARKVKKLKYAFPDDFSLYSIPAGWQFAQIGDIAWSIKDGPHYSPEYVDDGVPFITGGNVRPEGVDFDSAKRISNELHQELSKRCHPDKGDMLYTKGGTTGIACINSYDFEFNVWVHVAVIKYVSTVLPKYFQYVLNSPFCYEQSQKYTHGVGNQDLGLTRMINIIFPICSIAEQTEIVRILDSLFAKEQQAKEAAEAVLEKIDLLKKSILARAFRGELGTNDPSEESALELLKQVLQEDTPTVTRKRSNSIPKDLKEKLNTELERSIIKLYFKTESDTLPVNELLSVSSKKFEIMNTLRLLEQRKILTKLPNGKYRLLE